MGIEDFGLRGEVRVQYTYLDEMELIWFVIIVCALCSNQNLHVIQSKGKKYEFCFPKIQCKMMLNYDSDEDEYDGPTKSLREVMFLSFKLNIS